MFFMRIVIRLVVSFLLLLVTQAGFGQNFKILTNHLGYEQEASKRAVSLGHAGDMVTGFKVIDFANGKTVLSGEALAAGPVDHWKDWYFWTVDLSALEVEGTYV